MAQTIPGLDDWEDWPSTKTKRNANRYNEQLRKLKLYVDTTQGTEAVEALRGEVEGLPTFTDLEAATYGPERIKVRNEFTQPRANGSITKWTETTGTKNNPTDDDIGTCAECVASSGTDAALYIGNVGDHKLNAGDVVHIRVKAKAHALTGTSAALTLRILFYASDGTTILYNPLVDYVSAPAQGDVVTLEGFATAPTNSVSYRGLTQLLASGTPPTIRATQAQLVTNPSDDVPGYVDGAQPNCAWAGTADASVSLGYLEQSLSIPWGMGAQHDTGITDEQDIALRLELGSNFVRYGPDMIDNPPQTSEGGPIDWANERPFLQSLKDAGLHALVGMGIPEWMNGGGGDVSIASLPSNKYDDLAALWADFAAMCEADYPGVLIGLAWFNEFNLDAFYNYGSPNTHVIPSATKYVAILDVLYPAIKAVTDVPVLGGVLSNLKVGDSLNLSYSDALTNMYAAGFRIGENADALDIHAYAGGASAVGTRVGTETVAGQTWVGPAEMLVNVRATMAANNDAGEPIWVTETGVDTDYVSEAQHGQFAPLMRGWLDRQSIQNGGDIAAVNIHTLTARAGTSSAGYEMVSVPSLTRRPAAYKLRPKGSLLRETTEWLRPIFNTNWADNFAGFEKVAYRRVRDRVELRGLCVKSAAVTTGEVLFTLPKSHRPPATITVSGRSGVTLAVFTINTAGEVKISGAWSSGSTFELTGISFSVLP